MRSGSSTTGASIGGRTSIESSSAVPAPRLSLRHKIVKISSGDDTERLSLEETKDRIRILKGEPLGGRALAGFESSPASSDGQSPIEEIFRSRDRNDKGFPA